MKRSPLKRGTKTLKRTKLNARGKSDSSVLKERIQHLVRQIVIKRDGGCILREIQGIGGCNGYAKDGHLILQADHLVTRANSATYADTRLIVCVCKGHHGGFKKWNKERYDEIVRSLLPQDRVELWERAEKERYRPTHRTSYDWKLEVIALEQELAHFSDTNK